MNDDELDRAARKVSKKQEEDRKRLRQQQQAREEEARRVQGLTENILETKRAERVAFLAARGVQQAAQEEASDAPRFSGRFLVIGPGPAGAPSQEAGDLGRLRAGLRHGDKIVLPQSVLSSLDADPRRDQLQYPLLFRLHDAKRQPSPPVGGSPGDMAVDAVGHATHAGVLEFSAPDGCVLLPDKVRECLGMPPGSSEQAGDAGQWEVAVSYAPLPKGTFARLESLSSALRDVPDCRALLEANLRSHHATLSVGDIVRLPLPGAAELSGRSTGGSGPAPVTAAGVALRVTALEPEAAVSVIDTELSVDLIVPGDSKEQGGGKAEAEQVVPLEPGKQVSRQLSAAGDLHRYRFAVPPGALSSLENGFAQLSVALESNPEDGADLFVSLPPLLEAVPHRHHLADFGPGPKAVRVSAEEVREAARSHATQRFPIPMSDATTTQQEGGGSSWPSALFVGVHAFREGATYTLKATVEPLKQGDATQADTAGAVAAGAVGEPRGPPVATAKCGNCRRAVPADTLALHELHCARNCKACDVCGVVLKRSEIAAHVHCGVCGLAMDRREEAKHNAVWHAPLTCECGQTFERARLAEHRKTDCPRRLILCRFCGLHVAAGDAADLDPRDRLNGLTPHEAYCGSRTAPCAHCGRAVRLKEMDMHVSVMHVLAAADNGRTTTPSPSRGPAENTLVPCPVCGKSGFPTPEAWTAHVDSHLAATPAPPPTPCANEPCGAALESTGGAGGLCQRCTSLAAQSGGAPQAMLQRYFAQLTKGCGNAACTNKNACATASGAPMAPNAAAARALELVKAAPGRFALCLPNS